MYARINHAFEPFRIFSSFLCFHGKLPTVIFSHPNPSQIGFYVQIEVGRNEDFVRLSAVYCQVFNAQLVKDPIRMQVKLNLRLIKATGQ